MQAKWRWIAVGAAVTLVIAAVLIPLTPTGQKAIRYAQRRTGLGAEGRRARTEGLWQQAQDEYAQASGNQRLGTTDYPTKAILLANRAETLARVKAALAKPAVYPEAFYLDLLGALEPDSLQAYIRRTLLDGDRWWSTPDLRALFTDDELKALALQAQGYSRYTLVAALRKDPDQAFFEQYFLARPDDRLDFLEKPAAFSAALAVYDRLGVPARASLITELHYVRWREHPDEKDWAPWLAHEQDPVIRRLIYYYQNNPTAYLDAMAEDGARPAPAAGPLWDWERRAVTAAPESWHAQGIKAYEAVRGESYWEIDRANRREWGDAYYQCDREIPGWTDFLANWSRHDAADDAAYRLGRCYEITRDYTEALRWLDAVPTLGDGAMTYHAQKRIVWILDVMLDEPTIDRLEISPALQPAAAYTVAVKRMRTGHYAEAVTAFDALLARWDGTPITVSPTEPAFWDRVKEQRDKAARLALLSAADTPQARYDLAALMFHDGFLFYNYLWAHGRQFYYMTAEQAVEREKKPEVVRWVADQNNLIQSLAAFDKVPAPLQDKAAYSKAIALAQLLGYGRDVSLWRPSYQLQADAVAALEEMVANYPDSPLAPDALLTLGFVQENDAYFQRLLREYPTSNAAVTARMQLAPQPNTR